VIKVGQYQAFILETGEFWLDGGAVFGIIPKALWSKRVPSDERNRVRLAVRCLLLVGADRIILVDTGLGDRYNAKLQEIYRINPAGRTLRGALSETDVSPEAVTDVVITHLHFDHCGGALEYLDGEARPVFPHAVYHVQRANYAWALKPCALDRNSYIPANFLPLETMGRLRLLDGTAELAPGIQMLVTHGHTPGLQSVLVHDPAQPLFFGADLFPCSNHLQPIWISAFDLDPVRMVADKQHFLTRIPAENWRLVFPHDPQIAVAAVTRNTVCDEIEIKPLLMVNQ